MCVEPTDWERVVAFHGHSCPGLAIGFRAVQVGMARLNELRDRNEEIFAVAETDACGVDAVQVLSGCTLGKGNLYFKDYGKQAFTFGSRKTGKAVRVIRKKPIRQPGEDSADQDPKARAEARHQRMHQILEMPEEELFKIEEIDYPLPAQARVFKSVECSACGEWAMEPRMRLKEGKPVCLACANDYSHRVARRSI